MLFNGVNINTYFKKKKKKKKNKNDYWSHRILPRPMISVRVFSLPCTWNICRMSVFYFILFYFSKVFHCLSQFKNIHPSATMEPFYLFYLTLHYLEHFCNLSTGFNLHTQKQKKQKKKQKEQKVWALHCLVIISRYRAFNIQSFNSFALQHLQVRATTLHLTVLCTSAMIKV